MTTRTPASPEVVQQIVDFTNSPEFETGRQRYDELMIRSATNLAFRRRLIDDPMGALEEFYGREIPAEARSLDIRFIENRADVTIVLPDPVRADYELSEEELEAVAGGSPLASAAVSATGSPASAVISAIVSGTLALSAIWMASR